VQNHLWRQVFWRATEGLRGLILLQSLGKSIIYDLEVTTLIHQNILKLEVAVHNALIVQVTYGHDDLSGIELDDWLSKSLLSPKYFIELTALDERHDKVKSLGRLEEVVHSHEVGMITRQQNILL
jgi:hypothetical protein